ncbi:unnamed protein product [Rotaria sp. Silwood2]|nr:unnamed protein product [Rotaria sp. Silwood2]
MATAIEIDNLSSMIQDLGIEAFMIVARSDATFQPVPTTPRTLQFYDKVEIFTGILNFHLAPKIFVIKDVELTLNLIECNRSVVERLLNFSSLNDIIRKFKEYETITSQQVNMVNSKVLMPFTKTDAFLLEQEQLRNRASQKIITQLGEPPLVKSKLRSGSDGNNKHTTK